MRAKGIDISHWQGSFEDNGKLDFIIVKATEGFTYVDPEFKNFLNEVQKVPIRGAYHYFRTGLDPVAQAIHFVDTTKDKGFHFLAVDYEKTNNVLDKDGEINLWIFWAKLLTLTNMQVVLYTSPYVYRDNLCAYNSAWRTAPVWMAHYNGLDPQNGSPLMFEGSQWVLWQYTNTGKGGDHGVGSAAVDLNVYNGTVAQMKQWIGFIKETEMNKNWFSKTVLFSILFGLTQLAGLYGYGDFSPSPELVQYVSIGISVIGAIVGVVVKYFENKD